MAMVGHKRAFCVIIYWGMVSFSRQFSARRKRPLALSQLKYSLRESETDEPFEYTWVISTFVDSVPSLFISMPSDASAMSLGQGLERLSPDLRRWFSMQVDPLQ